MDSDLWRRLRAAYDRALDAPEEDRARLLEELRRTDPELAGELAKLLAANAASSDFLDTPLVRLDLVDLEPGVVLCGRFRLLRRIGHGGMGDVWAAHDQKLNEDVAVKTIRADLAQDPQQLARLKRELLLARRVSHPSVCKVFDLYDHVSDAHTLSFLTMELIEGETLADLLAREKKLPFADAVRIVRDIADGLAAAHTAGVVHRDLKPANIMLTAGDRGRRTVILDFGLAREPARVESDGATVFGTLVGTPEYMAPEQISGAAVTPSTDLYALGLMFFEMLDGTRPFAGVSTPDSWMRRAREGPKPLSGSVDGVRARTDAVIRKCLAYEPGERYQSAGELVGALSGIRLSFVLPDDRRVWVAVAALVVALLGISGFNAWRVYSPQLPPAEAMKWFEDAQQALAEGASVRALKAIDRAIDLAEWYAPFHVALAEIRLELDMPSAAQEAMLRANELAHDQRLPDGDVAYMNGMQALLQYRCGEAIGRLRQRAATLAPSSEAYALVAVARALERCNRPEEAEEVMASAVRLDPRNAAVPLRVARLAARRRDFAGAMGSLDRAESLFRDRNNTEGLAEVLTTRGALQADQDRLDDAEATLVRASEVANGLGDVRQQIRVRLQQAIVLRKRGDVERAAVLTADAIDLGRRSNLETLTLDGLFAAGNVHVVRSQFAEAQPLFERTLTIAETYRNDAVRARAQLALATLYVPAFQPTKVADALDVARPHFRRVGDTRALAVIEALLGQVRIQRAEYPQAIAQFRTELATAEQQRDPEQALRARGNLAVALAASGHYPEALEQYQAVAAAQKATGQKRREVYALLNVADTLSRMGRFTESDKAFAAVAALAIPAAPELRSQEARLKAGDALRRGDNAAALRLARVVIALRADTPERLIRATVIACLAAARLRHHADAVTYCDVAANESQAPGRTAVALESRLAAAEACWLAGRVDDADVWLKSAETLLALVPQHEDRWKAAALSVHIGMNRPDVASNRERVSRELEALRRNWPSSIFETWVKRKDVGSLLLNSVREPARVTS
jgi:eukaryotic-like serine/threonine-protein kinase